MSIQENKDFNDEIGKAFEKHSGILFSKILQKENSTYFNIKFDIVKAILTIKEQLIKRLFPEDCLNIEYSEYLEIKNLICICEKYLIEAKKIPNILDSSYIPIQESETEPYSSRKIPKVQNKYSSDKEKKNKINEYIFPVKIKYDTNETFNKIDAEKEKQRNLFEINSDFSKRKIISEDENDLLNRIKEKIGFNKDIQIIKSLQLKVILRKIKKILFK